MPDKDLWIVLLVAVSLILLGGTGVVYGVQTNNGTAVIIGAILALVGIIAPYPIIDSYYS